MQLNELSESEKAILPLLRQAFRPFFLLGALFSIIAVLLWGFSLDGYYAPGVFADPLFWHSHEMLFGFVSAIVIGFLLTAVQTWTGQRAPHGKQLLFLVILWLAGRLMLMFGAGLPLWLVMLVDVSFLPVCAYLLAQPILRVKQQHNLIFIPILLLLTVCNALMYLGLLYDSPALVQTGSQSAVLLITLLMTVIGGRVIPMFTANGTRTARVNPVPWLDRAAVLSLWLLFALHFLTLVQFIPAPVLSVLFAIVAVLVFLRGVRWRIWVTFGVPLLWSLHIAYWFIPLGLLLFAGHHAGFDISYSVALHALTAGAMGNMILSMISRVSLGHSGRALKPNQLMSLAFMLIIAAGLSRTLLIWLFPDYTMSWLWIGVISWVVAYTLYVLIYLPILTTPRPDGKPG